MRRSAVLSLSLQLVFPEHNCREKLTAWWGVKERAAERDKEAKRKTHELPIGRFACFSQNWWGLNPALGSSVLTKNIFGTSELAYFGNGHHITIDKNAAFTWMLSGLFKLTHSAWLKYFKHIGASLLWAVNSNCQTIGRALQLLLCLRFCLSYRPLASLFISYLKERATERDKEAKRKTHVEYKNWTANMEVCIF